MESKDARPVRIEWREGMSLTEYAARWVDMFPHIDALTHYASQAQTIVEFGVRGGVSTWALLRGLPAGGRVIGVDIDPDILEMVPPWIREDERLELIVGNDLTVDLPTTADLVVIDSGHEYQQTLDELDRAALLEPARIVLHKTSQFSPAEVGGCQGAADEREIDFLELIWIQRRGAPHLFRTGQLPPLRGTSVQSANSPLLILKGRNLPPETYSRVTRIGMLPTPGRSISVCRNPSVRELSGNCSPRLTVGSASPR